ncbi:MAG: hypothetical protein ACYC7E_09590 [Armatimonadota bacterium]
MSDPEQNSPAPQEMSSPPPPPLIQPLYNVPATPQRPTAATVIGVILIVLGGLSVLGIVMSMINLFVTLPATPGMDTPQMRQQLMMSLIASPTYMALYLVLGIGLLRMAPWARTGTIFVLPVLFVISTTIGTVNLLNMNLPATPGIDPGMIRMITMVSYVFGILFNLVMYGLFIFFLTRPNVVAAFERR